MNANETHIKHEVHSCPRCGQKHEPMIFHQFTNHSGSSDWSHWGTCPTTGEPICVRYAGGDAIPGIASATSSAHMEWAAEIRSIIAAHEHEHPRLQKVADVLDKISVVSYPQREQVNPQ